MLKWPEPRSDPTWEGARPDREHCDKSGPRCAEKTLGRLSMHKHDSIHLKSHCRATSAPRSLGTGTQPPEIEMVFAPCLDKGPECRTTRNGVGKAHLFRVIVYQGEDGPSISEKLQYLNIPGLYMHIFAWCPETVRCSHLASAAEAETGSPSSRMARNLFIKLLRWCTVTDTSCLELRPGTWFALSDQPVRARWLGSGV